jgi:hypothetical protein
MNRVVIIGRGTSGKSTLAVRLGEVTGLPVIELDNAFWRPGLVATSRDRWVVVQERLVADKRWIMDGDLGPCGGHDSFFGLLAGPPRLANNSSISRARRLLAVAHGVSWLRAMKIGPENRITRTRVPVSIV